MSSTEIPSYVSNDSRVGGARSGKVPVLDGGNIIILSGLLIGFVYGSVGL